DRRALKGAEIGAKLSLVLEPGEKQQKTVNAEVVRLDAETEVAVLKAAGDGFTALELGDDGGLIETSAVSAFGYPFAREPGAAADEFPSITVTTAHVTSLHKTKGELRSIQLDVPLNAGVAGGP